MFSVKTDNKIVVLKLSIRVEGEDWILDFRHETESRFAALVYARTIRDALRKGSILARWEAYKDGWAAAKAKRAKCRPCHMSTNLPTCRTDWSEYEMADAD